MRCALFVFGVQLSAMPGTMACPYERFADSPHAHISESLWTIDSWGQACGFGVTGGMEIRAANEKTGETVTIVQLADIITNIAVSSNEPRSVIITLPNLVDVIASANEFADVKVSYRFIPYDDPEARSAFQNWKHHPDDPRARHWACENIYARMDSVNADFWNRFFTDRFSKELASDESYCQKR